MADFQIVIAGFGGQGLLFSGKVLAYAGLLEGRELSWLPSYGPEMRGGTANCNVILSDTPVGSPIVQHPNVLMVMNNPSLDKYEDTVAPGGKIFVDSTLRGALGEKSSCVRFDSIAPALHKVIPARKADLFDVNMKAVEAGKAYQG